MISGDAAGQTVLREDLFVVYNRLQGMAAIDR